MVKTIFSGYWGKNHCQGITLDTAHKYVYYSFTTKLIKSDIYGNIIGSVDNITGHLGCIDFNDDDGKVYASLEYKNDEIGKGILARLGISVDNIQDAFYIAIFDVDKIDRLDMDAEKDGIMRAVYLKEVYGDFIGKTENGGVERAHVLGCSGIDGLAIGPDFGAEKGSKNFLHVCYGVYSDVTRTDNDYQVILQYNVDGWWEKAKPLNQRKMYKDGPESPRNKYFLYTGNTTYGVQNLEYDSYTGDYIACVYCGKKPEFPNYATFVIDGSKKAEVQKLKGFENGEEGKVLTLKEVGDVVNGVSGFFFMSPTLNAPIGDMGIYSMGDGTFYVTDPIWTNLDNLSVNVKLFKLETGKKWKFVLL